MNQIRFYNDNALQFNIDKTNDRLQEYSLNNSNLQEYFVPKHIEVTVFHMDQFQLDEKLDAF